jgi:hypothetical protein
MTSAFCRRNTGMIERDIERLEVMEEGLWVIAKVEGD